MPCLQRQPYKLALLSSRHRADSAWIPQLGARSMPDGQSVQSTGTALATLGKNPAADATTHAWATGFDPNVSPNYPNAAASVTAYVLASYSASVNLTALPASYPAVDSIPVPMTWTGSTNVTGSSSAQIGARIDGNGYV